MKKKFYKRFFGSVSFVLLFISIIALSMSPLHAAPLKFAVISDSHIYEKNSGAILDAVIKEVKTINASSATPIKYLVVNGDMVFNHEKLGPQTADSYQKHLETFLDIVGGLLKDTGIKLIMGRGNHDNHYTDDGDHEPYDVNYRAVMEKNKHLLAVLYDKDNPNYHFAVENVSFVMLNMVSIIKGDTKEATADITWLRDLKKDTKTHTFVFSHYPPFSANKKSYSMKNTSALLDCMAENGYQYYIAGHDHIFAHSILEKKDAQGKVVATINQIVCPNSAGGFLSRIYKGGLFASDAGGWEARLIKTDATFNDRKPGFLVVEVVDDAVGVTAYKMNFDAVYSALLK